MNVKYAVKLSTYNSSLKNTIFGFKKKSCCEKLCCSNLYVKYIFQFHLYFSNHFSRNMHFAIQNFKNQCYMQIHIVKICVVQGLAVDRVSGD